MAKIVQILQIQAENYAHSPSQIVYFEYKAGGQDSPNNGMEYRLMITHTQAENYAHSPTSNNRLEANRLEAKIALFH